MQIRPHRPGNPDSVVYSGRLWVPVFMMVGISLLSGSAGVQVGSWSFVGLDKLAHFFVFGLLGVAWVRSFPDGAMPERWRFALAVLLTAGFGLADEFHQAHNPLRTFEWMDAVADVLGAFVWIISYLRIRFLRRWAESTLSDAIRLRYSNKVPDSF